MLCLPKLILKMSFREFCFQHMFQHLHFFKDLEVQESMNLYRPYIINHIHKLWIFTLVIIELEWLPSIDRVDEASYHRGVVEFSFRVKGDLNIKVSFLLLVFTQDPIDLALDPRLPCLFIIPSEKSTITFQFI